MSLSDKSLLLITEDETTHKFVDTTLKPLIHSLVHVPDGIEGQKKLSNQNFDAFVLRSKTPSLSDPKQLFQWTQMHKNHKSTP